MKKSTSNIYVIAEVENNKILYSSFFTNQLQNHALYHWQLSLLIITSHSIPPQWPGLASYFTMYYSFFFFLFSTQEIYLTNPKCRDKK